jgi:hypothetical protein
MSARPSACNVSAEGEIARPCSSFTYHSELIPARSATSSRRILAVVLPLVYDRFSEASAKAADLKKGVDALFTVENLNGLPPVFSQLALLRDERGKPVFKTDVTPLSEVMAKITEKANYGEQATGKLLEEEFSKPPFGWDFEAVRLLALSLLRAGAVGAVSKGVTIDTATSTQAKEAFTNNNLFRSTSFRPRKGVDMKVRVEAAENFKATFGDEVKELATGAIAAAIREAVEWHEDDLQKALVALRTGRFPGAEVLENALNQIRAIRRSSEENAITTFNASHRSIREAIQRATDLSAALTETALADLERAKTTLAKDAPALLEEPGLDPAIKDKVAVLSDRLSKETFFRDIAEIEQAATAIADEHKRRYDLALDARVAVYADAVARLEQTPGWEGLDGAQKEEVARALRQCADRASNNQTISHLRSVTDASEGRLATAVEKLHKIREGERVATVSQNSSLVADYAEAAGDARRKLFAEDAAQGFGLAALAVMKYDIVTMNPPFGMISANSKPYLNSCYPLTKNDIYYAFVERAIELLVDDGLTGAITSRNGFFQASGRTFREGVVLKTAPPAVIADLGFSVLDSAVVETAAFVLEKGRSKGSTWFRLTKELEKAAALRGQLNKFNVQGPEEFGRLPGSPFLYWLPESVFRAFRAFPAFESEDRFVRCGMGTLDDARFVRNWWEVGDLDNWTPFAKGGDLNAFFSDISAVVNFLNSGYEIKTYVALKVGSASRKVQAESFYFRPGLQYGRRIRKPAPAVLPIGAIFSDNANGIFVEYDDKTELLAYLSLLNTSVAKAMLTSLAPVRKMEVGFLQKLPVPVPSPLENGWLAKSALHQCRIRISRAMSDETSRYFVGPFVSAPEEMDYVEQNLFEIPAEDVQFLINNSQVLDSTDIDEIEQKEEEYEAEGDNNLDD